MTLRGWLEHKGNPADLQLSVSKLNSMAAKLKIDFVYPSEEELFLIDPHWEFIANSKAALIIAMFERKFGIDEEF